MTQSSTKSSKVPASSTPKATPLAETSAGAVMPSHLSSLTKCAETLATSDGRRIDVWELRVPPTAGYLSEWASNFRQHYCSDSEIDDLRAGTGLSRADYLTQLVFPDKNAAPGPGIRAGDFAELLISDYVEYLLGYWVPRGKYAEKSRRVSKRCGHSWVSPDLVAETVTYRHFTGVRGQGATFRQKVHGASANRNQRLVEGLPSASDDSERNQETTSPSGPASKIAGGPTLPEPIRPPVCIPLRRGRCLVRFGIRQGFATEINQGRGAPKCGKPRAHRHSRHGADETGTRPIRKGRR